MCSDMMQSKNKFFFDIYIYIYMNVYFDYFTDVRHHIDQGINILCYLNSFYAKRGKGLVGCDPKPPNSMIISSIL